MFKLPKAEDQTALMERYKKLDAENSKVIQQPSGVVAWDPISSFTKNPCNRDLG